MEQTKYDVFISYRRKGGSEKAQLVKSELILRGIADDRIFLDTHSLHVGDFEQKIKIAIKQSKSIVVIISNGCFDDVKETDYWYMEIKEAFLQSKTVVPIFFDGITSFGSLNVPEELFTLSKLNAVTYQHEYSNAAFDKLSSFINTQAQQPSIQKQRGCIFKYRSCLISFTLICLLLFILVPITYYDYRLPADVNNQAIADAAVEETNNPIQDNAGAGAIETSATAHGDASVTIRDYYQHIYTLKLKRISVEYQGRSFDPGISLSNVICGTAFVLSNGTLVTARQNIEPWIFWRELGGEWRKLMAEYVSLGCNVILEYDAYSTAGTAKKLSFSNQDFLIDRGGDVTTDGIEIGEKVRVHLRENGIDLSSREFRSRSFIFFSPTSSCYALLKGKGGVGIPYDAGASLSSDGGTEVQVAGFKGNPDIHNLEGYISYFKSSTSHTDTQNGTIVLQDANSNAGYLGSPVFVKEEDGTYCVIGLMVGKLYGENRIVPIASCN